jgi:hypothetical protein
MMARDHDQSGISHTRLSPKLLGNGKSQKYLEFNGPKLFLIGEWCKARMHLKREGDVGFLCRAD